MTTITINGRRWFQKSYGNTYFTVAIHIDGKPVYTSKPEYGYGSMYLQAAQEWLANSGLVPPFKQYANGSREPFWQWAERTGIQIVDSVADVSRERDLHH